MPAQQLGPAPWGSGHRRQPDPEVVSLSHSLCLYGVTGNVGRRNGHSYFVFGLETALKLLPSLVQEPPDLLGSELLPLPWCGHSEQGGLLCCSGRGGEEGCLPLPRHSPGLSQQHPLPELPMLKLCFPSEWHGFKYLLAAYW